MKDLIKALQIFEKYQDNQRPTYVGNDALCVSNITEEEVTTEDKEKLENLGFFWSNDLNCWASFFYGNEK